MSLGRLAQDYCQQCGYTYADNQTYTEEQENCCYYCDCNTVYIPPIPPPVTLRTLGTGADIVVGGIGPDLTIKSVSSGPGITFNDTNGNIEISSVSSVVTIEGTGTTGESIVAFGTGPNLKVKNLAFTGTGLSITSDANNNILFENTSPASSVSLNSTGAGVPLVPNPNPGPTMSIKSLVSGTGITMSQSDTEVTIQNIFYPMFVYNFIEISFQASNSTVPLLINDATDNPPGDPAFAGISVIAPGILTLPVGEFLITMALSVKNSASCSVNMIYNGIQQFTPAVQIPPDNIANIPNVVIMPVYIRTTQATNLTLNFSVGASVGPFPDNGGIRGDLSYMTIKRFH